ncbi:hypothetical protein KUCAC02_015092 [Chaenocephalus aceratus]|uniref:Uncharacterized protein n=1 Tax=Chaenocephalus aceratus TaxID=36190 RepID=A0ACB9XYY0_CHAAC|nr:hypothetical protein KUCAC02_015092 [Chaenocephalus aceratus]
MAASSSAVTVLTPNGRRQAVKVSPNTPLLQVLEDVCKKHGFNPDDHGLKFQRTALDLTLPWRFANLPNNAKLEMVTDTRKQAVADSQVRIALQMEDGSRHQGSFSCGQTLWELLTHFPQISVSETESTPVCVYMRDEVSGEEALKKTTLRSLGLTGGNAIVRFLLKKNKAEGDSGEATEAAAMPTMLVAKKTTPSPSSLPEPAPSPPEMSKTEMPIKHVTPQQPVVAPTPASAPSRSLPFQKEEVPISQDAVRPKVPPVERVMPEEDGGQRLGGPQGGAVGRPLSSSSSALTVAVDSPKAKKLKSSHGSSIKGQSTANQPDEDMDLGEFSAPAERELLIYHLDAVSRHSDHRDLPDEFFEVTMDDVRKRFAQLKSQRWEEEVVLGGFGPRPNTVRLRPQRVRPFISVYIDLAGCLMAALPPRHLEEAPLMTKALRESQMREKMERYPKVVLRVQFPDRHVLQGFFRPLETVGAVRQFVSSHLEDPELSFYLSVCCGPRQPPAALRAGGAVCSGTEGRPQQSRSGHWCLV